VPGSDWKSWRLRHQLQVLERGGARRVRLTMSNRWLWIVLARLWTGWRAAMVIVKPETVIAWHRRGFACVGVEEPARYRPTGCGRGCPTLIRTMVQANPRHEVGAGPSVAGRQCHQVGVQVP
jgi:putative transposase